MPAPRSASVLGLLAGLALALLPAPSARAQETQAPLDRAGRVERIDAKLARRLGLFGDHVGFQEARLFMAPDSSLTLEVTSVRGGRLQRERVALSAGAADSLRARVSALIAVRAPAATLNQEGRVWLLVSSSLLGLGFYGWALPVAADLQDEQAIVGTYLLTAGGSFFLPFAATAGQPISYGMTNLALYGATRGIVHGILLYDLAGGQEFEGAVGAALAASVAEGVAGYVWARSAGLSSGSATTIANLGDFGLLNGLAVSSLADYYSNQRETSGAAVMLLGSAAGMFGGSQLAAHRRYSYGDASVMRDVILLGVLASQMVTRWSDPEGTKPYIGAAMAGSGVGLAAGDFLVRDTDFSAGQSVLVTLGTLAGGTLGLGLAYLTTLNGSDHGGLVVTASTLGAGAGFAATYLSFRAEARRAQTDRSSWRLELSPVALAAGLANVRHGPGIRLDAPPRAEFGVGSTPAPPLLRVEYRF